MEDEIILKVKEHCLELLTHSRCNVLPFHSVKHTLEVFENVQKIGEFEEINNSDLEILKIAALFHDTGLSAAYSGHEDISANNAILFLSFLNYPQNKINAVLKCIDATKMPQRPVSLLEKIICDADLFHLSNSGFITKNKLLRLEWQVYLNWIFSDDEWIVLNSNFLKSHSYHTSFGKSHLEEGKNKNLLLFENGSVFVNS
jgi:predicted metal-dependent HD superfamily phosphohydrolase